MFVTVTVAVTNGDEQLNAVCDCYYTVTGSMQVSPMSIRSSSNACSRPVTHYSLSAQGAQNFGLRSPRP